MERTFVAENQAERERLFTLTGQLDEVSLKHEMPNGWTVAETLAHLAFWDSYCVALVAGWEKTGYSLTKSNVEATNAAAEALARAIPATAAVPLVREAAEAADAKVERIAPELVAAIEAGGQANFFSRFRHRRGHLDKIAKELGL
jgi:hypothetical protein